MAQSRGGVTISKHLEDNRSTHAIALSFRGQKAMKASCVVYYGKEILAKTPTGTIDLEASKRRIRESASEPTAEVCEVLFDLRGAQCTLTPSHLNELALEMGRIDPLFIGRIALLSDEAAGAATPKFSPDRRYQVGLFANFDEAMQWLTAAHRELPEHT
jgi:hypothetical protein